MEYTQKIKENGPMPVSPAYMPPHHGMPNQPFMPVSPAMHMPCPCHHGPMAVSPVMHHPMGCHAISPAMHHCGHRGGEREFILIVVLFILLIIVGVSFIH